ncbi:MAG TPA: hypothetical protein VHJ77_14065 [Vicinamibacterales bacterium]|nr:hypothetical protein [Vicinamibacterales bacterium]
MGAAQCARDDHYDAITTTYQLYARTGTLTHLVNARRWALHHRRDQINLSGPDIGHPRYPSQYLNNTRYTFPQGLIQDYFMFGDEQARQASAIVVDNFYLPHAESWYYKAPNTRGFWTEREAAFSLIGIMAHYEGTGNAVYLNKVRDRVASLRRMQVDNGGRARVHNLYDHDPSEGCGQPDYGSSPWMSGLLLEAIIKYHKLTNDPLARESILMAVDDLRARYLATGDYAYRLTGAQVYRTLGTSLFNTSVENGVTASHKHYDQQFRSSGHFPAYLSGPAAPPPPSAPANLRVVR